MVTSDATHWAAQLYGEAELGDPRRADRLVSVTAAMAAAPGLSLPEALQGDQGQINAAYRFLRNKHVEPRQLLEPCLQETHRRMVEAGAKARFLAIGDTTSLYYGHRSLRRQLGTISGHEAGRGLLAHTSIVRDADSGQVMGLIEQQLWMRAPQDYGIKHKRRQRRYEDKESYKWERQDELIAARLGEELMRRTITVVDREADVFEYLQYKLDHRQPFVLRSSYNRCLTDAEHKLNQHLRKQPVRAVAQVAVGQRGGRRARLATVDIRVTRVTLRAPDRLKGHRRVLAQRVNALLLLERQPVDGQEPLCWVLFTDQAIAQPEDLKRVMGYYSMRWLCEEYHRAWKSDVGVESWRVQSLEQLERVIYLTASVAMRVLQLQKYQGDEAISCLELLSDLEWRLLWVRFEKEPLPEQPPSAAWAYRRVARLGGWYDSKRTGRAGARALKRGVERLEDLVAGHQLAQALGRPHPDDPNDETSG